MTKLKVGLIGIGNHFLENIIPAILLNKNLKIDSIYSSNQQKLDQLSEEFDVKNKYSNWQKLISDRQVDCIFVSGTPDFHSQVIFECIKYSMPFFVEKPPFAKISDFDKLEALPINMVGYNFKFSEQYILLQNYLTKESKISKINLRLISNKPRETFWNQNNILESYLYAVGIHGLDLICSTLGDIVNIKSFFNPINRELFSLTVFLEFKNKKFATLDFGNYANSLDYKVELINQTGESGTLNNNHKIELNSQANNLSKKEKINLELSSLQGGYYKGGYQNQIDHFASCLLEQKQTASDITKSKQIYTIIQTILTQNNLCQGTL